MYRIPELERVPGLFHAFSTAEEGNMSFRYGKREEVVENRKRFLAGVGVEPASCISFSSLNEVDFLAVDKSYKGQGMTGPEGAPKAGGLFTQETGVHLFLFIADCIPLILLDPMKKALGLVHVGRKEAGDRLPEKAIEYMRENFGTEPRNVIAAIGPAISRESYVKRDLAELSDPQWRPFLFEEEEGLWAIDLKGYTAAQLFEAGVGRTHSIDSGIDTATDGRFFSHVRSSRLGLPEARFACVAGLQNFASN
jgi:copper oxidase (laccase) domain-containing protein